MRAEFHAGMEPLLILEHNVSAVVLFNLLIFVHNSMLGICPYNLIIDFFWIKDSAHSHCRQQLREGTELICELPVRCPGSATRLELLPKAADAEGRDCLQKEGGRVNISMILLPSLPCCLIPPSLPLHNPSVPLATGRGLCLSIFLLWSGGAMRSLTLNRPPNDEAPLLAPSWW